MSGRQTHNLIGQRFFRLVVVERSGTRGRAAEWLCVCDCGTAKTATTAGLKCGKTKSCGCWGREHQKHSARVGHGHSRRTGDSPEYTTWRCIKSRCMNPRSRGYEYYGGRGITVCARWLESFDAFLEDMGTRPGRGYSIDRIDNDGNYEPGNCRWATRTEQVRNSRAAKLTADHVAKIEERLRAGDRQKHIARDFSVCVSTVHLIAKGLRRRSDGTAVIDEIDAGSVAA